MTGPLGGGTTGPVCRRCKREARGWPLRRADVCSPKRWVHCLREPVVVAAENAAGKR